MRKPAWILAILAVAVASAITGQALDQRVHEALSEARAAQKEPERIEGGSCAISDINLGTNVLARIDSLSCNSGSPDFFYYDFYRVHLTTGQHLRATYTSQGVPQPLAMFIQRDSDGTVLATASGNGPQVIDYFAPNTAPFIITVSSLQSFPFGNYSLLAQSIGGGGNCTIDIATQCLQNGRFKVTVAWTAPGQGGTATAVPMTGDTGYFWFFNSANVELVVKVLDGRAVNGRFWVFYGALSNVQYTIRVTDTQTSVTKFYSNAQGQLASVADTGAF